MSRVDSLPIYNLVEKKFQQVSPSEKKQIYYVN